MEKYSSEVSKLVSEGSKAYSHKDYELACDKYGEACQEFSEAGGEEDADLLFLYGKALFHSAVTKSEVFGGSGGDDQGQDEDKAGDEGGDNNDDSGNFQFYDAVPLAEDEQDDGNANAEDEDEEENEEKHVEPEENNPNNEDGEENAPRDATANEQDQSDFEVAWDILDLTRSIWESQLEKMDGGDVEKPYTSSKDKDNEFVTVVKKLSETYDLLGEVSLEAENFPQAAIDLQKCLDLRKDLYGPESSLISESHYKLSLALEFCVEDPKLRQHAAEHTKLAIESIKARTNGEIDDATKKENNELIADLEARYNELKKDPNEDIKIEQLNVLKGILGEATNPEAAIVNQLQPKKKAAVNDLTGSIKKRKTPSKENGDTKKQKN
jgi:HAT1-interacting factor 1